MFGVQKSNKPKRESAEASSVKPKPKHQGRERLKHFDEQIRAAHNAIEELEQQVARLGAIVVQSEAAQRALQAAVHADGGLALANYSSGQGDEAISKLVAAAKTSSEASTAAVAALPHAEASLENARAQLVSLVEQKQAEIASVMAMLADVDARRYQSAFDAACVLHDKLCGYAAVMEGNIGDVRLIVDTIKMPRFALPSMGNRDADPFIRHSHSELTVNQSAKSWSAIRSRLEADSEADIEDLQ